jgi:hypothetical protein
LWLAPPPICQLQSNASCTSQNWNSTEVSGPSRRADAHVHTI